MSHRKDSLKSLLDIYKFKSAKEVADVCVELLDAKISVLPDDLVVIPVPTAPGHRRYRGFDHTHLFASQLAKRRNLPYRQVLERTDNQTQHFKTKKERLVNASRGLRVKNNVPEKVLLVDDIYTTGATLQTCTEALRSAGAKQVFVAVIARQPK
ncbi:MAG: phosphoribosyltransferase family protein [Candidatus Saccharimonadales bacterium]